MGWGPLMSAQSYFLATEIRLTLSDSDRESPYHSHAFTTPSSYPRTPKSFSIQIYLFQYPSEDDRYALINADTIQASRSSDSHTTPNADRSLEKKGLYV